MRKIVTANYHMVDGEKSYRPGDTIEGGQIMKNLEHYESLGQVTVTVLDAVIKSEPKPEPKPEPKSKAKKG